MNNQLKVFFILFPLLLSAGFISRNEPLPAFQDEKGNQWVDSVFATLSPDERIAQLFMVAAYSNKDKKHEREIDSLVIKHKIGGLIFFQGGPVRQAVLTNRYQKAAKVPLLISIDGEWGLAMRLDSTTSFPKQMTLGAIQDETLIYEMGKEIARQCKRIGIHVNLAPVADVNNNPLNPVIGYRSFGEDKYNVARKAVMYMKGMQDNGVMANGKHFPGHGDTDSDSHKTLPTIASSKERMDSLELYPFRQMIKEGLGSMMVAHLYIPAYDTTRNTASTLSKKVVTDLLKNEMQFQGLVFTDALNMKGVSKFFAPGIVDVKALLAGNDVLLFAEDVPTAIDSIKKAIARGEISQEEIDQRCKKILKAKQWCGLDKLKPIRTKNLFDELNTPFAGLINRKLVENAMTLLSNRDSLIPLKRLDTLRIACVSLGHDDETTFYRMLHNYAPVDYFGLNKKAKDALCDSVIKWVDGYNLVIIQLDNLTTNPAKDFGLTEKMEYVMNCIIAKKKTIVSVFGSPYVLARLDSIRHAHAVVMNYEGTSLFEDYSAQLIFGGIGAKGRLPVTASEDFKLGQGLSTAPIRLKYTVPEEAGMSSSELSKIDSIALKGMKDKAYPGCQVLVVKEGKVVYQKAFGFHTYENKRPVKLTDLYDLASVTKISASTPALMRLVEEKKVHLDSAMSVYYKELNGTNKEKMTFRQVFTHQSGLPAWIPFWKRTVNKGVYRPGIYSTTPSKEYPYRVAEKLYISRSYPDSIMQRIISCEVDSPGKFVYSDLGYYLLQKIIEAQTGKPLDQYVTENFYRPLGLSYMGYKPRERFNLKQIAPTEYDVAFRKQLVWGDVHDQGAAMLGGVAGHAGLFANANDLAILMQMFLQKGEYGGMRYFDTATVAEFTRCQYCIDNRRAIGFDKPETNSEKTSPVCECVSYLSFGHTGFTGTIAWADPEKQLVYVFLSNRVYPDAEVNKLAKQGIRTKIQEVIYSSVNY
ncbi:MAG: glycoside hydrolase family 3 N-terminal domain-containing protein [Bacteroidota bacterium]